MIMIKNNITSNNTQNSVPSLSENRSPYDRRKYNRCIIHFIRYLKERGFYLQDNSYNLPNFKVGKIIKFAHNTVRGHHFWWSLLFTKASLV